MFTANHTSSSSLLHTSGIGSTHSFQLVGTYLTFVCIMFAFEYGVGFAQSQVTILDSIRGKGTLSMDARWFILRIYFALQAQPEQIRRDIYLKTCTAYLTGRSYNTIHNIISPWLDAISLSTTTYSEALKSVLHGQSAKESKSQRQRIPDN